MRRRDLLPLLGSCHPGPVVAVSSYASAYAAASGAPPGEWATVSVAVLAGQLAIGWDNDVRDARRDANARRRDKPIAEGRVEPALVRRASLVALAVAVAASLATRRRASAHLVGLASGLVYNAALKATPLSPLPYALAFSLLPRFAYAAQPSREGPPRRVLLVSGLLGLAAHFMNVLPDRAADREQGVLGLPQRLSPRADVALAAIALSAGALACPRVAGGRLPLRLLQAATTLGATTQALTGRERRAFLLVLLAAGADLVAVLDATLAARSGDAARPARGR
jgi:4-hydroxybenzoate polyprenyltransferase